jgi:type VI secretion system protein ImpC
MKNLAELLSDQEDDKEVTVLDMIIEHGKVARDKSQIERAEEIINEYIQQIPTNVKNKSTDAAKMIAERINFLDKLITEQLNEILHNPTFQTLEASWRGLDKLLKSSELSKNLIVKVYPVNKKELLKDFERSSAFDRSALFKLIYEEEFGTLGGAPFGIMVTDFTFGRASQDIRLLEELSHVAASAHAPLLAAPAPSMFDLDSFTQLSAPRDLGKIFESGELSAWRNFREADDSRYVAMALPRVLMRMPYGPLSDPVEDFDFRENCNGVDHEKYLWGSAAWSLAERIIAAYNDYGWCAAIRGVEGGGLVESLPIHEYQSITGDYVTRCPTEISITDRREKELSDLGFIPLCYSKGTNYAVFFGGQSTNKPPDYSNDLANANARLASMLPYILAASRFAHYMKSIMRDKIGSFQSRTAVEEYLNKWVTQYVTLDDQASQDVKSKYPLREASVKVHEIAGRPGAYSAVLYLRPHFQLEELTASIRLVAELPSKSV